MRRTVLLADDSVTIRKVVELTFCDTDIRVESVASGQEALDRLAELRPDLVLADVVMPDPTGYEICRAVKSSDRPVPVLLLAGTFEPFDPARAAACGSDGHLVKPFDSRTLVERVETLLAAGPRAPEPEAPTSPKDADAQLESMIEDLAGAAPAGDLPAAAEPPPVEMRAISEERAASDPARGPSSPAGLSDGDVERIARRVVERLSDRVLREIAWDVVPDLAEAIVRERIRQLEREESEAS